MKWTHTFSPVICLAAIFVACKPSAGPSVGNGAAEAADSSDAAGGSSSSDYHFDKKRDQELKKKFTKLWDGKAIFNSDTKTHCVEFSTEEGQCNYRHNEGPTGEGVLYLNNTCLVEVLTTYEGKNDEESHASVRIVCDQSRSENCEDQRGGKPIWVITKPGVLLNGTEMEIDNFAGQGFSVKAGGSCEI